MSQLTTIDNESSREKLIKLLPKVADGWTYMCKGLTGAILFVQVSIYFVCL